MRTDLVVGPWNLAAQTIDASEFPGHRRHVVTGVGDSAVFFEAETIDDGNSILFVSVEGRSFLLASEFVTLNEAEQLAEIVLTNWS